MICKMKDTVALTLGVLLAADFVLAGCVTDGGYKGAAQVRTAAEAKNSPDDTPVQLQGKIERRFSGDREKAHELDVERITKL
jgi:uncharacterized protein YdeI (BOF family)